MTKSTSSDLHNKRGLLAKSLLTANDIKKIYEVPVNAQYVTASFNLCNFGTTPAVIRVWATKRDSVQDVDIIEPGIVLQPNDTFLRAGLLLSLGERLFIRSDSNDTVVRVEGMEDRIP